MEHSDKARQYRERAREMLVLAEQCKDPEQRRLMLDIAAVYHRLASHAERKTR